MAFCILEPFYRITVAALRKEEELYGSNFLGIGWSRMLMRAYELKNMGKCLNVIKRILRILIYS